MEQRLSCTVAEEGQKDPEGDRGEDNKGGAEQAGILNLSSIWDLNTSQADSKSIEQLWEIIRY